MNEKMMIQCSAPSLQSQRGATLLVALLLLLAMTLLGTRSMNSLTLEEKMVSSMRDSNVSFQSAESGLADCENDLAEINPMVGDQSNYWVQGDAAENRGGTYTFWWDDTSLWEDRGMNYGMAHANPVSMQDYALSDGGVSRDPLCIREHIGLAPDDLSFETRSKRVGAEMYTVTAKGFGAENTSVSIVQSLFFARYK